MILRRRHQLCGRLTPHSVEPDLIALAFSRRVLDGDNRTEVNPLVEAELAKLGATGTRALDEIRRHGSLRDLTGLPAELRRHFPISLEIAPEYHLRMQAAFQNHVDAAVSKTVNLRPTRHSPPSKKFSCAPASYA